MAGESRTGGRILVDQLRLQGVDTVFGVPGESYLEVLDALHDTPEIRFVVCRQEGGAAMMATAWGELTGRPGIAMVTRGPGATNASSGVHVAQQDSVPMILFVGQIDRGSRERDTFQEVDYRRMFGGMAKWVAEIDDPARIPEFVHRAFATATAGRPGPVVLALPEDMLVETAGASDGRPAVPVEPAPASDAMAELHRRLSTAERPFVIVGGGGWNAQGVADFARFLEANDLSAAAASAGRICSTTSTAATPAISAWDPTRSWSNGSRLPIGPGHRGPAWRDHQPGLHPAECAAPGAGSGACAQRPRGAGARLPARPRRTVRPQCIRPGRRRAPAGSTPPLGRGHCGRACRGARLEPPDPDRGASWQLGEVVAWLRERLPADAIRVGRLQGEFFGMRGRSGLGPGAACCRRERGGGLGECIEAGQVRQVGLIDAAQLLGIVVHMHQTCVGRGTLSRVKPWLVVSPSRAPMARTKSAALIRATSCGLGPRPIWPA